MKTTIGMDLGDRKNQICILDDRGNVIQTATVGNTRTAIGKFFGKHKGCLVAIETGTHSPWISRQLGELGCEVLVGNTRKLRAIWDTDNKTDVRDAEMLARIARLDPRLLHPVEHRSEQAQVDLEVIKARTVLKRSRVELVNHIRCIVKSLGYRLPSCGPAAFHYKAWEHLPDQLRAVMLPLFECLENITESIREYDRQIKQLSDEVYPETCKLQQVRGVGPVTALAYVLTLEHPERFSRSRSVGPFLGLVPKRDQSGNMDKQLHITKAGDRELRCLLVNCAQYIMGPFGEDCDLRRFGETIAQRGGKNARRRAVVAVARKLAVLLHALWKSENEYEAFYGKAAA